jgi:serine/threonine-protein kinase
MDSDLIGKIIGERYYITQQLGRGSIGITFLAEDQQCFNNLCVVKQFQPEVSSPRTLAVARRLFNKEAEILSELGNHNQIPHLLAYFEEDRDFFLVQELIEGHNLNEELSPNQLWSEKQVIAFLKEILNILVFVQKHGVIHRDIKPSNIMRRKADGKIILIDFGSVKQIATQIVDAEGEITPTVIVGTAGYMPIEQIRGFPGFYSDIYAVGTIAIEALTGIFPKLLPISNDGDIIWRDRLNPQLTYNQKFLDIIDKMVCDRFQDRYQLAAEVLEDLLNLETNNLPEKIEIKAVKIKKKTSSTPKQKLFTITFITGLSLVATSLALLFYLGKFKLLPIKKMATYKNKDYGIEINYPQNWDKQTREDFFTSGIIFISPKESEQDSFQEEVSVFSENLASPLSLSEYTQESIKEIKKLSDPHVSSPHGTTLADWQASTVIYQGEENGYLVQRMQVWTVINNKAYIITYTAQPEKYDRFLPVVEQMIGSFAITE